MSPPLEQPVSVDARPNTVRKFVFSHVMDMNNYVRSFLVQDLATRFADGRLSSKKILDANDEELAEMLIEVRGIGRVR